MIAWTRKRDAAEGVYVLYYAITIGLASVSQLLGENGAQLNRL